MHIKILLFILLFGLNGNLFAQNKKLDSLFNELKMSPLDTGRVNLYINIAQNQAIRDSHLMYMRKALTTAEKIKSQDFISRAEYYIGAYYTDNSELDSARYYFEKSLKKVGNVPISKVGKKLKFALLYGLATVFMKKQDVSNTLYYAQEMMEYGKEIQNDKSELLFCHILGSLYTENNNLIAIEYFQKGLKIAEETHNIHMEFSFLSNIANCYKVAKNYVEEEKCLQKALILSEKMQDKRAIAYNQFALGLLNNNQEKYEKAYSFLTKSLVAFRQIGEQFYITSNLTQLANSNLAFGKLDTALAQAKEAAEIAKSQSLWQQLGEAYQIMKRIYAKMGNYEMAYNTANEQQIAKDSAFNKEKATILTEYQTKYHVSQKTKENDLLKKEQEIQKHYIKNQTIIIVVISLAFLIVSLLGMVIYKGRKREESLNATLSRQKEELQSKNRLLEELNTVKDKLFSIISHDLRSPLASLKNLLMLLNDNTLSENQVKSFFPKLTQDVDYTFNLLDGLLYWAKNQLYGIHANPQKFALRKLMDENVNLMRNTAEQKQVHFINDISANTFVFADEDMTRTILRNLLSNALKFTEANGHIRVFTQTLGKEVEVTVEDTGVGMSEEVLSMLFKGNFTTMGTKNEKGTGLGLMLVKDFVEKNGGNIRVESEFGKGCRFIFNLPLAE